MSEQNYIVRIYRSKNNSSGQPDLDGVVEIPENGMRQPFHDLQSLWNILAKGKSTRRKKTPQRHR